jgi:hypothetical protein
MRCTRDSVLACLESVDQRFSVAEARLKTGIKRFNQWLKNPPFLVVSPTRKTQPRVLKHITQRPKSEVNG